jgi:hypothetical protein
MHMVNKQQYVRARSYLTREDFFMYACVRTASSEKCYFLFNGIRRENFTESILRTIKTNKGTFSVFIQDNIQEKSVDQLAK